MNEFLHGKIPIDKFIKHHNNNFINYCEVVIDADGDVRYCIPSHQETLIRLTNIPREKLFDMMLNSSGDIMKELCNLTHCVSVWYEHMIYPDVVSEAQRESIQKLINNKCIVVKEN